MAERWVMSFWFELFQRGPRLGPRISAFCFIFSLVAVDRQRSHLMKASTTEPVSPAVDQSLYTTLQYTTIHQKATKSNQSIHSSCLVKQEWPTEIPVHGVLSMMSEEPFAWEPLEVPFGTASRAYG
jgi:hypothetical protein